MIKVTDNILTIQERKFIEDFLYCSKNWQFLWTDFENKSNPMLAIDVMRRNHVRNAPVASALEFVLARYMGSQFPNKQYHLHKINVNGQYRQNQTRWHTDIDYEPTDYNLIYHVNTEWDSSVDGGEYMTRDQVVDFVPGRFVLTQCDIEHIGTAPKSDKFRMTVAWTFKIYD
jgi:hypothetical protein